MQFLSPRTLLRIGSLAVVSLLPTPDPAMAEVISPAYFYPVVTNTAGNAGTRWATEVTVTNPHEYPLVIKLLFAHDGIAAGKQLTLAAMSTRRWANLLQEAFTFTGNGALAIGADEAFNPGMSIGCRTFLASVRIYNSGNPAGTFGQEIPPVNVTGFIGEEAAYFSGVQHYGTPGVDGFRTNYGLWYFGAYPQRVKVQLYSETGVKAWQTAYQIKPNVPLLYSLPSNLELANGVLVVSPDGPSYNLFPCAPFISVIDNRTGDASYRSPIADFDQDILKCGGGMSGTVMDKALQRSWFQSPSQALADLWGMLWTD